MKQKSPWTWVPTLYFAKGLPVVLVMTLPLVLYMQMGLGNVEIAFCTSWLCLPWLIRPLWKPFLPTVKTMRWWTLAMQLLVGVSMVGLALVIPTSFGVQGSLFFFWLMAFASAIHGAAADDFYRAAMAIGKQKHPCGVRFVSLLVSAIFAQGVLVMAVGNLQVIYRNSIPFSWSLLFFCVAGLAFALWLWHGYALPRVGEQQRRGNVDASVAWMGVADAFNAFVQRRRMVAYTLFMLLFFVPEGLLMRIAPLFLIATPSSGGLGLSPQEYSLVQGTVGVAGLAAGMVLGRVAVARDGLGRWFWPMVCAATLPKVLYMFMGYFLPSNLLAVNACVLVEQMGFGFGLVAYFAYAFSSCRGEQQAVHDAMALSLFAGSFMLTGLFSGALQETVGYRVFFAIVLVCCTLTFAVASMLTFEPGLGRKTDAD